MNELTGDSAQKAIPSSRPPRRPGPRRRGGRGRRPQDREQKLPQPGALAPAEQPAAAISEKPARTPVSHPAKPQLHFKQSNLSPIATATAQVEDIIQSLKDSLRDLEEVLEILDDAQRQQIGDEKEIESLRRSLSVLQRERQSPREREPRERFDRGRSENRNRPEQKASPAELPPEESGE